MYALDSQACAPFSADPIASCGEKHEAFVTEHQPGD
jgi:hypothetical protein